MIDPAAKSGITAMPPASWSHEIPGVGGSQHWDAAIRELGHVVRLSSWAMVRPRRRSRTTARRGRWRWPGTKTGCDPRRTGNPGAASHAPADRQINGLRGLGPNIFEAPKCGTSPRLLNGLRNDADGHRDPAQQWASVAELQGIGVMRRINWHEQRQPADRRTPLTGAMGSPSGHARVCCLVSARHSGTGGRVRMLAISKRGDDLRTSIHGARAVLTSHALPERLGDQLTVAVPRQTQICAAQPGCTEQNCDPGGAKLVLMLCGTRCWGVVPP